MGFLSTAGNLCSEVIEESKGGVGHLTEGGEVSLGDAFLGEYMGSKAGAPKGTLSLVYSLSRCPSRSLSRCLGGAWFSDLPEGRDGCVWWRND